MRTAGIVAATALSFAAFPARADSSKAWSAARVGLPADARIVVGLDFAVLKKTQLFAAYYPKLLDKAEVSEAIDAIKTICKIDPLTVVQGVVIASTEDQQDGAAYVSLAGLDKARLSSCLQRVAQHIDKTAKITVKHDGNVTQISDGQDSRFVAWVGKDVLVLPVRSEDKASIARWTGGKGSLAKSTIGKTIAKLNTSAPLWAAGEVTRELQPGVNVKRAFGTVTISKGNLDADAHAVLESASQAQAMASSAKQQLDEAKQATLLPPAIGAMLKTVTITTANDELVVKGSVVEADLLSMLALAGL